VPYQAVADARAALLAHGLSGKSQERDRRVSDAEINRLIAHFERQPTSYPMPDLVRFCLATAMRIGEVCRLTSADLDEAAKTVVIRDRKHPTEKAGNDQVVPLLAVTGYDAFAIATAQPRDDERIFPYSSRTIGTYFTRAAQAGKLADLHLHDLRHEAISRFFAAGFRIEQVAVISGHRSWAMLKRYTHIRAADLHAHAANGKGAAA